MRLIDADKAVKDIQEQAKKLQNQLHKVKAQKPKNKDEETIKEKKIQIIETEIAARVDFLSFLINDCKEIKISTKEKE